MKKLALICLFLFASNAAAQTDKPKDEKATKLAEKTAATKPQPIKTDATPLELAQAALAAHGGDKFKNLKSITQFGSVEVSVPNSAQTLTATYKIIQAGDKFRFEINSQFVNFQQISDGQQIYSSFAGIPPISQLGLSLLTKIEEKGYTISALPDKKKRRTFRITTPDGYMTDFSIDAVSGQVLGYEARFIVRDREVSTAVEHDKFRDTEGALLPEKFSQRLDMAMGTFYVSFKAKEVAVNTTIADDVFAIPQQ